MKSSHTPGPWFVNGPWHIQSDVKTELPTLVAHVTQLRSLDLKEREANARLIAAAPELLEACKFVLSQLDQTANGSQIQCKLYSDCLAPDSTDDDKTVVDYLREIVTKAESNA